ncbi:MAG TPA: hypothetical protein VGF16_08310 [Bryobacteraceae bacterium]|jgi:hypothetical protein
MSYRLPATADLSQDAIARGVAERIRTADCPICMGPHEQEIHEATTRVRRWFRSEVTKGFRRRPE